MLFRSERPLSVAVAALRQEAVLVVLEALASQVASTALRESASEVPQRTALMAASE